MEDNHRNCNILNYFTLGYITQCDMAKCYFITITPEILDWEAAYGDDLYTNLILQELEKNKYTN